MDNETVDKIDAIPLNCKADYEVNLTDQRTKSPLNEQTVITSIPESPEAADHLIPCISNNGIYKKAVISDSESDVERSTDSLFKEKLKNGHLPKKRFISSSDEETNTEVENPLPSTSEVCLAIKNKKTKFKRLRLDSSDDDEATIETNDGESRDCEPSSDENTGKNYGQSKLKRIIVPDYSDEDNVDENKEDDEDILDIETQEERLQFLEGAFPNHDKMELQDALIVHKWSVEDTIGALTKKQRIEKLNRLVAKKEREKKLKKRREECVSDDDEQSDYKNEELWDSDDSSIDDELTSEKSMVLKFFQVSPIEELTRIPGCLQKKAEIILSLRPFKTWTDLVNKFENSKTLSGNMINNCKMFLHVWEVVNKLMQKCEKMSTKLEKLVHRITEGVDDEEDMQITEQPKLLNKNFKLKPYQMIGLNWLVLMDRQELNGILADEMGLGKTIQAIGFLAHLMEQGDYGPHLVIVPSSTLDNWVREIKNWCPKFKILIYFGHQEERKEIRYRILNDEIDEFHIVVTTYNMVSGAAEDRIIFKKIKFHYVVLDEAHMLKNMASLRYQNLMKIRGQRRLLLTGTPLQNNLVELMSLLCFVMPHMFHGKTDYLKQAFATVTKNPETSKGVYEESKIEHAKRIIKPFILRRLKSEVLQQLPKKVDEVKKIDLSPSQRCLYDEMISRFSKRWLEHDRNNHSSYMMELRKMANHPLLVRNYYTDERLQKMAKLMLKEPTHYEANEQFIFEDMQVMSDFELNRLCKMYYHISKFKLSDDMILNSGKFNFLDQFLPESKEKGDRVLLFSQFVIVLDVLEEYMKIRKYKYFRLDGSTQVKNRQELIDRYNNESDIFIFLLSTRAGGLGINLTAANTVILHDIDFNPYNDKQAEDRCHRVGQMREVRVMRLISKNTIEENMLDCAQNKLRLEKDVTTNDTGPDETTGKDVATLLKQALGIKE